MSIFGDILKAALEPIKAAKTAVFADGDGEAIDEWSRDESQDEARFMGAHWGVILSQTFDAAERTGMGTVLEITIHGSNDNVIILGVRERFYLALSAKVKEPLFRLKRILAGVRRQISEEM